jgi:hypothetical protein
MRSQLVTAIETEAQERVAATLAELKAPALDDRESALVTLAIRAGIGATLAVITEETACRNR